MAELESLQADRGSNLLILTMNVDEEFQIPGELEVSSLPALALYQDGNFVRFIGGLGKKEEIRKEVERGLCS
jgi:thioredoxin-like negative regulator of GroEL